MQELVSLLPLVAIALLFWLLVIRPAQRRQKQVARMQGDLAVGDDVMLTSGVFGTLRGLADDHVRVEVAEGVVLKVARAAVGSVVPAQDPSVHPDSISGPEGTYGTEDR